jgi:peptidoglycan hydrolase FlgJ
VLINNDSLRAMNSMTINNAGSGSTAGINSLERNVQSQNDDKIKQACSDFEAIFIKMMLDSMRKTVEKTSILDGGMAEEIFEDMIYDEYAKKMSKTGDFGLKDILYKQLSANSSIPII